MELSKLPSIPGYYAGANVFITGSAGYIGKVLIEKLLWSCPEIGNLYLLLRPKKGMDAQARVDKFTKVALFDRLRAERPDFTKKLKPINGDLMELNLGLSDEDRRILQDKVNIIFHAAANVRFDDTLKIATLTNLRSTRELLELAKGMKKLKVFVHVSTTYCNTDKPVCGEYVHPPRFDWRKLLEITEHADELLLKSLSHRIFDELPNSYVFTKSLTENLVDEYRQELPILIVRPSVVIPSYEEPVKGWLDNFNNVMGLFMGSYKGIFHAFYQRIGVSMDYVPIDIVVKAIIVATVKRGTEKKFSDETPVINISSNLKNFWDLYGIIETGMKVVRAVPSNQVLWYPSGFLLRSKTLVYIIKIITQFIPAFFLDVAMKLSGRKPMFLNLYSKIERTCEVTGIYGNTHWNFLNDNLFALLEEISEKDLKQFNFQFLHINLFEYMKRVSLGGRRYLFNETDDSLPEALRKEKRMYIIHNVLKYALYSFICWKIWGYVRYYFMLSPETIYFNWDK